MSAGSAKTTAGNGAQRSDRIAVETGSEVLSGHCASASFPAVVSESTEFIEIVFTHDDEAKTLEIVRHLVAERLIACGQITPGILSVYRWKGNVEEAREVKAAVKTRLSLADEVCETIRRMHTYEVPEIVVRLGASWNPDYSRWLAGELTIDN